LYDLYHRIYFGLALIGLHRFGSQDEVVYMTYILGHLNEYASEPFM